MIMEQFQNYSNWNKAITDVPVLKRKRFLARKIHKLKKILKFGSKSLADKMFEQHQRLNNFDVEIRENYENEKIERQQNYENEELERKFLAMKECQYETKQNIINESWDNWDGCYLCGGHTEYHHHQPEYSQWSYNQFPYHRNQFEHHQRGCNSICYVFMPGQLEPVPVKLRNAKIPGGVMWISYRPDVDMHPAHNLYSFTSSQIPQGQHPIVV
ncbi:hypothetical protein PGB90_006677 [Kerria lacca]